MKNRALLTIIISILTGFILGFVVSSQITRLRTRDVRSMSSSDSFKSRTYSIINPGPEQLQELDPVVERYSEKFDSMKRVTRKGYSDLIESYHQEIKPHLTKEQYENLENFAKHLKSKKHHHKDKN